jgi:hypothetical protein
MAKITIRFFNGDEAEWTLHDAMDLGRLAKDFAMVSGGWMSFGVASEQEEAGVADYGFVGVRMEHVASWHIEGMVDPKVAAALFAELQTFEDE